MKRVGAVLLLCATALAFLRHPAGPAAALVLSLVGARFIDPAALRGVLRVGAVLAFGFAAAITAAAVAWSAGAGRGVSVGAALFFRLLVLTTVATTLARTVDAETILRAAARLRLTRLGLVLGLALNALPHLIEAARDVWAALLTRRPSRYAVAFSLPRLAEVLLAHCGRIAEESAAAAALRGHDALTQTPAILVAPVATVVVTGAPGCGKTTALVALVEARKAAGAAVAGFLQPGIFDKGGKSGFLIRDVATGEEVTLARRVGVGEGDAGTRFRFDAAGLRLARRALARASAGDLLVIDELGPLELRGGGHMSAARQALAVEGLSGAVIVVRRSLVPQLLAALRVEDAIVVDVGTCAEAPAVAIDGALGPPQAREP